MQSWLELSKNLSSWGRISISSSKQDSREFLYFTVLEQNDPAWFVSYWPLLPSCGRFHIQMEALRLPMAQSLTFVVAALSHTVCITRKVLHCLQVDVCWSSKS